MSTFKSYITEARGRTQSYNLPGPSSPIVYIPGNKLDPYILGLWLFLYNNKKRTVKVEYEFDENGTYDAVLKTYGRPTTQYPSTQFGIEFVVDGNKVEHIYTIDTNTNITAESK